MAKLMCSDGNGGLIIPKWFLTLLGVVVLTGGLIAGYGIHRGVADTTVALHIANCEIHTPHSELKDEFVAKSDFKPWQDATTEKVDETHDLVLKIAARMGIE